MATMKFKKETGLTILNAIQEQRMKRVDDLLANTTLPIATVVAQCGYKSDAFVKRMFLERHGTTMRDYRRQAHDASDKTQA
jgi:transcriptional regulator GlxA family with amidase domain